jgi:YfiH family protein
MDGRPADWLVPQWPAPANVHAWVTSRNGGVSAGPWGDGRGGAQGLNLGLASGDEPRAVLANRARLRALLPAAPRWLHQVHGAQVVDAEAAGTPAPAADAAVALAPEVVCAVTIADCLPVLFAERHGRAVAAAHAGWRGLAAGVLQATVERLRARLADPQAAVLAWLGPAIGPQRFEVGAEVLMAMQARLPQAATAFVPLGNGKYLANLYALAQQALASVDVTQVGGGECCTASEPQRYYSHRRDRVTGRQAAVIWIDHPERRASIQSV